MSKKKRAKGGGRKQKFGEPTQPITMRVPVSKIEEVAEKVNEMLSEYATNKPTTEPLSINKQS